MEDCRWLSDKFRYICCNGDNKAHVAEWCPYDGCHEMCKYYESIDDANKDIVFISKRNRKKLGGE